MTAQKPGTPEFTPGPWEVVVVKRFQVGVRRPFGMDKCTITEANASLIAAAPDLYTALQQLVDYITPADSNDYQTAIGRAKAALARASGEVTP